MELAIPLVALAGLYFVSKKEDRSTEGRGQDRGQDRENFRGQTQLPNVDIPNKNYPEEYPVVSQENELTSKLSTVNAIDSPYVYTDKYFNPNMNQSTVNSYSNMTVSGTEQQKNPYYSLTGDKVNEKYFSHNNMVPYFGSHIRSRTLDGNSNESILDSYQGQGSQTITKSEQSPLFAPGENYNYAFGAPNQNDFYQSRVNPSLRMANVKPFEEERVAPGLGLGYTTEGSGGYNSGMAMREKWLDRGVDELRVTNHQKSSEHRLLGHEGPSISNITMRGEHAPVNKNQQETAFELGADRLFTTVGQETKPTARGTIVEKFVNRPETTASYTGIAGAAVDQTYHTGEYMPSTHQDLGAVPIGIATGSRGAIEGDYNAKSLLAYPNNRTANQANNPDNYFGVVSGVVNAAIAPLLDVLRPSRKENTIGNLRLYENAQAKIPNSYLFNPADRTSTTNREMTEKNKYIYGVNANQRGGAYETTEYQAAHNERDTTTDFFYAGASSAAARTTQPRVNDAEYNQRNNDIKASTINGRMVPGNMSLLGTDMNMRTREGELANTRPLAMTSIPNQLFTTNQMGKPGLETKPLYQNIELDRNSPEILSAFRNNPYTHSLTNIA
jgi:hypothetical protein